MRFYRTTNHGRSVYLDVDDKYVIEEGEQYKWYAYHTPGGPAVKLTKYPNKFFSTATYVIEYNKIVNDSPNGEW